MIMVHGSTHTGACLEATPDGREGWYPYFVRKGVPSYVVDQAGRGRSGFDQSVIHEGEAGMASGDVKGGADTDSRASAASPTTAHGPRGSAIWCRRARPC